MLTCLRTASLITRSLDDPLRGYQRAGVALHALVCGSCRRFRRQIMALDAAATELIGVRLQAPRSETLPSAAKLRLKNLIRERL